MKIILPIQGFITFSVFLLFSFSNDGLHAQNCMDCSESTQTLYSCDTNGDGDAVFDLDDDITVSNGGNVLEFYTSCTGSGTLSGEITGGSINNYQVTMMTTIYARELSGNGGMDTCVQIVEVDLVPLIVNITPLSGTVCTDSPQTLTANVVGGDGSLSYTWKRDGSTIGGASGSTYDANQEGDYTVEVEDSGAGCTAESTNEVTLDGPSFSGTIAATGNIICDSDPSSNVTLTANPSPGDDNDYTYRWETPGGANPTSISIVAAQEGEYDLTITEIASGCGIVIDPFDLMDGDLGSIMFTTTDPTCLGDDDGEVTINISGGGGSGDYEYNLDGTTQTGSNADEFTELIAGTYGVTVTDTEGAMCSATSSVTLDPGRTITMTLDGTDPTTFMGDNGEINVMMTGMPTYEWDWAKTDPVTDSGSGSSSTPSFDIEDLVAGDYSVTVTDKGGGGDGCSMTGTVTLNDIVCTISVSNPNPSSPTCNGDSNGSITINVSNPIGLYTVSWSETDNSPPVSGSSYTITGLGAGSYDITVEDTAGCQDDISNVNVSVTPPFTFNSSLVRGSCQGDANGEILVNSFNNGATPYSVTWSGPVGDTESTSSSSFPIEDLPAGTYTINVTDANGCTNNSQQVTVNALPNVNVSIVGDATLCPGDSPSTLSTSPSNFEDYSWSPGGSNSSSISVAYPGVTTVVYSVEVEDANQCTGTAQIQVEGLAPISISLNSSQSLTSLNCNSDTDGKIFVNVSGGDGDYTYAWTGPGTNTNTPSITNKGPGDYMLTVTDDSGCSGTFMQSITVPQPIVGVALAAEVTCNGDSDGEISVSAQGGTPPYDYNWSSPIPSSNTSSMATGLSAGTYTVTIEDKNGCFVVESATVTEPNEVVASIAPVNPQVCFGEEITLTASGGTSYSWSGGQGSGQNITVGPLSNTTYTVTVTDANTKNCTDDVSIEVTVNQLPTVTINPSETSGNVNNDGTVCEDDAITLTASGGSSYVWVGGNSNPYTFTPPVGSSSYTVTVTDNNDCVNTGIIEVNVDLNPVANFEFNASQIPDDPQNINNTSQALCGELINCTWLVEDIGTLNDCDMISPTFLSQGGKDIKLTVENSCGCIDEVSRVLEIGASDQCAIREFTINNNEATACVGQELEVISEAEPSGPNCPLGIPAFEVRRNDVVVSNGDEYSFSSGNITFNEGGTYQVKYTISDGEDCGCTKSATRTVNVIAAPDISFATDNPQQGCEGTTLNIGFGDYDDGDKILVSINDGEEFSYESSTFEFNPPFTGVNTLEILNVDIGICDVPVNGQVLEIDVFPEFKIVSEVDDECDDDLRFTYTVVVEGGDPNSNLSVDGIDSGTFLDANTFSVGGLSPGITYEFTISRGDVCDAIPITINKVQCDCTFDVGVNNTIQSFEECEGTPFILDNFFTTSMDFSPETDTIVYVLHQKLGTGKNLGNVVAIYPFTQTSINSDFTGFISNSGYKLSAVGIRKASIEDDLVNLSMPSSLSNGGENECLSVVNGLDLIWRPIPQPSIGTLSGSNEICKNAYDFPIIVGNLQDGSDISISVEGLSAENINFYGFQDTAYIYFEDNGQDSFEVVVTETKFWTDSEGEQFSCSNSTSRILYVKEGNGAPPLSEIIYWPGNILASTADSSTTCFQWGFYRGKTEVFFTDNATSKFFYAPSDADIINGSDIYFVDTYFCDNPDCVTRIFFNNDGPIPGLIYKDEETFEYLIRPNPSNGNFTVNLLSKVEGEFQLELIDATGTRVHFEKRDISLDRNDIEISLEHLSAGIYFIRIYDKVSGNYSTDKVIIN